MAIDDFEGGATVLDSFIEESKPCSYTGTTDQVADRAPRERLAPGRHACSTQKHFLAVLAEGES
jgi:hypothetical protein